MLSKIILQGVPVAKKRARFARRGKFVRVYDSQSEINKSLKIVVASQWNHSVLESAISLSAKFFMPIPKSTSKKNRLKMFDGEIKHTKRPDCDNLVKNLDILTGIVFKDDSQIYEIHAEKLYSDDPRTEISIEWDE